jgi:hypothetical protein
VGTYDGREVGISNGCLEGDSEGQEAADKKVGLGERVDSAEAEDKDDPLPMYSSYYRKNW